MNTVEACEGILSGKVKAFIGLGGNFVRAIPERGAHGEGVDATCASPSRSRPSSTAAISSTARVPIFCPASGAQRRTCRRAAPQAVTIEDTFSCIHGSIGRRKPASEHLMSEVAIVAGIAKATLPPNPKVAWDEWIGDYALIRDLIAETYPDEFHDFNARMWTPGGFYRGNSARERIWKTESGKAEFTTPEYMSATGFADAPGRYRLITMRSNDQFNTTIYGFSDRLRGIEGTRDVLLINPDDMRARGLARGAGRVAGQRRRGRHRSGEVGGLKVTPFSLPDGCLGAYYPEMNPLVPLWLHDEQSKTPASKSVPVRIKASASA